MENTIKFTPELFINFSLAFARWAKELEGEKVCMTGMRVLKILSETDIFSQSQIRFVEGMTTGVEQHAALQHAIGSLFHTESRRKSNLPIEDEKRKVTDRRRRAAEAHAYDVMTVPLFLTEEGEGRVFEAESEVSRLGFTGERYRAHVLNKCTGAYFEENMKKHQVAR